MNQRAGLRRRLKDSGAPLVPVHTARAWGLPLELWAGAGLVCVYAAVVSGYLSSVDGNEMFWQAMALALRHSLHFPWPVPVPAPGFLVWNSKYGIGLSLLYVPGIMLLNLLHPSVVAHAIPPTSPSVWRLFALVGAPTQIVIAAGTAVLVSMVVRELGGGRRLGLAALLLYGVASPAIIYARLDFAQPLEALCYMLVVFAALRARRTGAKLWPWVGSAALLFAVLARPVEATLLVPLVIVLSRRRSTVAVAISGYAVGVALTLLINWLRFASPLTTGYGLEGFTTPLWVGLPGSLLSPGRGILWSLPICVFAPRGVSRMASSGLQREAAALAYVCIGLLLVVSAWNIWWGGYDWGLRLFVPAMPLVVVLGAMGLTGLRPDVARLSAFLAGLLGLLWCLPGVVENGYPYYVMANGTSGSWALSAYPPFGAWQFLHGWLGNGPVGHTTSSDVLWLALARANDLAPLIPMALLLLAGATALTTAVVLANRPARSARPATVP